MEDLALLVSLLMLLVVLGGPVALALSFVKNQVVRILAMVLAVLGGMVSIQFVLSAQGNRNAVIIGIGGLLMAVAAVVNSLYRGRK